MKLLAAWTIRRAEGLGLTAGCVALILWVAYPLFPDGLFAPFVAALAVTAGCGLSVLGMTVVDLAVRPHRGESVRPIRAFDAVVGVILAVPSLIELKALLRIGLG